MSHDRMPWHWIIVNFGPRRNIIQIYFLYLLISIWYMYTLLGCLIISDSAPGIAPRATAGTKNLQIVKKKKECIFLIIPQLFDLKLLSSSNYQSYFKNLDYPHLIIEAP